MVIKAPVLFLHADRDKIIDCEHSKMLHDRRVKVRGLPYSIVCVYNEYLTRALWCPHIRMNSPAYRVNCSYNKVRHSIKRATTTTTTKQVRPPASAVGSIGRDRDSQRVCCHHLSTLIRRIKAHGRVSQKHTPTVDEPPHTRTLGKNRRRLLPHLEFTLSITHPCLIFLAGRHSRRLA
jgi:hypothetical protein